MRRHLPPLLALLALAPLSSGCPGSQLKAELSGIRQRIQTARDNGAYLCAPVELAMAEAHADFASAELYYGNYFPAKEEVEVAGKNANLAVEKSPKGQCLFSDKPRVKRGPGDRDGDGILDDVDKCPNDPEDKDGFEDEDGCPDLDNDKDGILDTDDKCPNQPGPKENQGCPDTDRDKDGVVDRLDACPDEPGPPPRGCPERKFLIITKDKIELKQKIHFATNKSKIFPDSFDLLNEVAEVLKGRPELLLRIEGHTDNKGKLAKNMVLSDQRAASVRDFLVKAGVGGERLVSRGFGPTVPVGDNKSNAGREQNRRTEFYIITADQMKEELAKPPVVPEKAGKKKGGGGKKKKAK